MPNIEDVEGVVEDVEGVGAPAVPRWCPGGALEADARGGTGAPVVPPRAPGGMGGKRQHRSRGTERISEE